MKMNRLQKTLSLIVALIALWHAASVAAPTILIIKKYKIMVDGKPSQVFRIEQPDGTWGYRGVKGQYFDTIVKNQTDVPTVVHWHGLILPNDQDGVPYVTQPVIPPGGQYVYHYKLLQAGTYWMHSHYGLQEQLLLSAPFIIDDPAANKKSEKDITLFLADFSWRTPKAIFKELQNNGMKNMHHDHAQMGNMKMSDMKSDLNDVKYDAYLANYKTLKNPEIIRVKPGDTVRLRVIDGAAASNFFINLGKLQGVLFAADGSEVNPIAGSLFQVAIGQRIDVRFTIPKNKEGVYPVLAQGEGTQMQTGIILATPNAKIPQLSEKAKTVAGALDYSQEWKLKSLHSLSHKAVGQTLNIRLEGNMAKYVWELNEQKWPKIKPFKAEPNKRIEIVFQNLTPMAHPMHLHGHVFQVTEIDGKAVKEGAMRDTILVLPNSTVKVQFDSDNPGNWMLHCHITYHQAAGMMNIVSYEGYAIPKLPAHAM